MLWITNKNNLSYTMITWVGRYEYQTDGSGFYAVFGFDILLKANFTKSSHVITIGT